MDFRVFSRNISENMHARCVREDTKQALKGNLQADGVQSRQTLFVRYCLKGQLTGADKTLPEPVTVRPDRYDGSGFLHCCMWLCRWDPRRECSLQSDSPDYIPFS